MNKIFSIDLGVVMHDACNPSSWETKAYTQISYLAVLCRKGTL